MFTKKWLASHYIHIHQKRNSTHLFTILTSRPLSKMSMMLAFPHGQYLSPEVKSHISPVAARMVDLHAVVRQSPEIVQVSDDRGRRECTNWQPERGVPGIRFGELYMEDSGSGADFWGTSEPFLDAFLRWSSLLLLARTLRWHIAWESGLALSI